MILIALGANLTGPEGSTPVETCEAATSLITGIAGLEFVAKSQWYRTASVPRAAGYPDYCNGVVRLTGEIDAEPLLSALQAIEQKFGRQRSVPNAPRTLDLDIIDLNGMVRAVATPILPHPRAHERAFVLRPMLDVAPAWRHPVLRQSLSSLLAELPAQQIQPWFGQDEEPAGQD